MKNEDRYEVIDADHGEGGFGRISKNRDKILDRYVAVKQLRMLDNPDARERFKREAKALARMSHPNVPAIYDVQFDEQEMHIYFEFIEGRALRELVKGETIPSLDKASRWFTQVAAALEHAHSKGIVHRDIKPDNIVISPNDENATLVDFGIALTADDVKSLTKEGYAIGTPTYMSPEQARGADLDGRSDLYSLGITLYETLAGHLPLPAGYKSISEKNEAIPPAIDELIKECLVQDRTLRIQTASDFIKRLRSAFRTDVPLSTLLTDARLHELVAALKQISAEDFSTKPKGQKLLLINRLKDLVRTDKPELRNATADVIALLTRLARFEEENNYQPLINSAFVWGYDKLYGSNWQGNEDIREALIESAKAANETGHHVLASQFIAFLINKDLTNLFRWYTHDLRILVTALLANPVCDKEADQLAILYDKINEASH